MPLLKCVYRRSIWPPGNWIPVILHSVKLTPYIFPLPSNFLCQRPSHTSSGSSQTSHRGDESSVSSQFMWDSFYSITPPMRHTNSLIYDRRYIISAADSAIKSHTHTVSVLRLLTSSTLNKRVFWLQNHVLPRQSNNRVNVIKPPALGTSEHTGSNIRTQTFKSCDTMRLQDSLTRILYPITRFFA